MTLIQLDGSYFAKASPPKRKRPVCLPRARILTPDPFAGAVLPVPNRVDGRCRLDENASL